MPMTTSTVFAVPIIERVREAYPLIDLRIVDGMSADVSSWLLEGRLDVAILYEAHNSIAKSAVPILESSIPRPSRATSRTVVRCLPARKLLISSSHASAS